MERELAIRMLAAIRSFGPGLDEATYVTQAMVDEDEARLLRRHLGMLMTRPLYDIVMHIVRPYPDLDPGEAYALALRTRHRDVQRETFDDRDSSCPLHAGLRGTRAAHGTHGRLAHVDTPRQRPYRAGDP